MQIIHRDYDVLVAGGGTAGIAAAMTAAMEGARVLLLEKETFLGGAATGGQVIPMMPLGMDGRDSSFLNRRIKDDMEQMGARFTVEDNDGWFNPELLKFQHEQMLTAQGVTLLYDTQVVDCDCDDNGNSNGEISAQTTRRIRRLRIFNRGGLQTVTARMYIDCTGDAWLAHSAGVPCVAGDGEGRNQSMSLRFIAGHVDIEKLLVFLDEIGEPHLDGPATEIASLWRYDRPLRHIFYRALQNGDITEADGAYFQAFTVPGMPGAVSFNGPQLPGLTDANDPAVYTRAALLGREMILRLHRFLQKYICGFEHSYIQSVALPGVRESRRIVGAYVLTAKDYLARRKFPDAVARTNYPIDIHDDDGARSEAEAETKAEAEAKADLDADLDAEAEADLEAEVEVVFNAVNDKDGQFLEIPYRVMVTPTVDNLLVAGRCVSADFAAQSAIRIQPTCRALGEAAGIAAALCVKENAAAHRLDGVRVRKRMAALGAFI